MRFALKLFFEVRYCQSFLVLRDVVKVGAHVVRILFRETLALHYDDIRQFILWLLRGEEGGGGNHRERGDLFLLHLHSLLILHYALPNIFLK